MAGEARPKTMQEHRGIKTPPTDRTKPYSAASYAAQYGVKVEDAADLLERSGTHQQVERGIFALYKQNPRVKDRALFRAPEPGLTEAQKRKMEVGGVDVAGMVGGANDGKGAS